MGHRMIAFDVRLNGKKLCRAGNACRVRR